MNKDERFKLFFSWIQGFDIRLLQNEDDVETKFILPLLSKLGYPEDCRRGKFPVKTYAPGKGKRGKYPEIDQIYFSVSESDKQNRETSLVIVEAKSPNKSEKLFEKDIEQARFYGNHLEPVFLILTDGCSLRVLKRRLFHENEIVFSIKVYDLKKESIAQDFYNQLNFDVAKHVKENVENVLLHEQYTRVENVLSFNPAIREILEKGDFEDSCFIEEKRLLITKPKVALECELPKAFEDFKCRIFFSNVTRRGLKLELNRSDILGTLFLGLDTPPDWQSRLFIRGLDGNDAYKIRLAQMETVLSKTEIQDLCVCVDILGRELKRIINEIDDAFESWDFRPTKVEGIPGFHLLSVTPQLWLLMKQFANKHDFTKGRSKWHIFHKNGQLIRISVRGQEHAILWPRQNQEYGGVATSPREVDVIFTDASWLTYREEKDFLNWKECVGPMGLWSVKYT